MAPKGNAIVWLESTLKERRRPQMLRTSGAVQLRLTTPSEEFPPNRSENNANGQCLPREVAWEVRFCRKARRHDCRARGRGASLVLVFIKRGKHAPGQE